MRPKIVPYTPKKPPEHDTLGKYKEMKGIKEVLALNLKLNRLKLGLTQKNLAEKALETMQKSVITAIEQKLSQLDA